MKTRKKTILTLLSGNMKFWLVMLLLGWASTGIAQQRATWDGKTAEGDFELASWTLVPKTVIITSGKTLTLRIPAGGECWITRTSKNPDNNNANWWGGVVNPANFGYIFEVRSGGKLVIKRNGSSGWAIIDGGAVYKSKFTGVTLPDYAYDGRTECTHYQQENVQGCYGYNNSTNAYKWYGVNGGLIWVKGYGALDLQYTILQNQYNNHHEDNNLSNWVGQSTHGKGGAAIFVGDAANNGTNRPTINLTGCIVRGCQDLAGGALDFSNSHHLVTFTNVQVYGNYARAMYNNSLSGVVRAAGGSCANLTVSGGEYHNNKSKEYGGCFGWYPLGKVPNKEWYGGLTINNNALIHDNITEGSGGGLFLSGVVTITSAKIYNNEAANCGGGIDFYCYSGPDPTCGRGVQATLGSNVEIYNNTAKSSQWGGGGVYAWFLDTGWVGYSGTTSSSSGTPVATSIANCYLRINGSKIYGNTAPNGYGGGVLVEDYMPKMTIANNGVLSRSVTIGNESAPQIYSNTAKKGGGGIAIRKLPGYTTANDVGQLSVNITNAYIGEKSDGTSAFNQATGGQGGGIFIRDDFANNKNSILNCQIKGGRIVNNKSSGAGGGVFIYATEYNNANNVIAFGTDSGGPTIGALGNKGNTAGTSGGGVYIGRAYNVTVKNSTVFSNTASGGAGGGFYVADAQLTVTGGYVGNNTANGNHGGGFYIGKSSDATAKTATFSNCVIGSNSAGTAYANTAKESGGGICYNTPGTLTINGASTDISNNKATTKHGGGVYSAGTLSFSNGKLYKNEAGEYGGGFYITGGYNATFTNCIIGASSRGNKAGTSGGGICYNTTGTLTISGASTDIRYNEATSGNGGGVYSGGALSFSEGKVYKNTAGQNGGGFYITGSKNATFTNCDIGASGLGNTATNTGGGIYYGSTGTLTIGNNSTTVNICYNTATNGGGGGVYSAGTLNVTGGQILRNTAGNHGGGFYITGGNASFKGCYIGYNPSDGSNSYYGNTAVNSGGGICYNNANGTLTIGDASATSTTTRIGHNVATNGNGGGVWAGDGNLTVTNTAIGFNKATNSASYDVGNGGGIYVSGGASRTITIGTNTTIGINEARSGGGLYVNSGIVSIGGGANNTLIYGNQATSAGGGVRVNSGRLAIHNKAYIGTVSNDGNTAPQGGGVYATNTDVTVDGGNVYKNEATNGPGGGFYIKGGNATFSGCNIGGSSLGNTATNGGGGGIYYDYASGTLTIGSATTTTTISHNTVSVSGTGQNGGGIHLAHGRLDMTNSTISYNHADNGGGGVFVGDSEENRINLTGGTIDHNTVGYLNNGTPTGIGGGVLLWGGKAASFDGVNISNNSTYQQGGGIYARRVNTTLKNGTTITNNEASYDDNNAVTGYGGGVYIRECTVDYEGSSVIENNTARLDGGGVYIFTDGVFNMKNSTIQNNTAQRSGGGVYVRENAEFTMWSEDSDHPCKVVGNTAIGDDDGTGGGVYHKGTTMLRGLIFIEDNTSGRAANNMYLDQAGTVHYSYIHEDGLLCYSRIGINNETNGLKITEGLGTYSVDRAQYAFRNEFFFSDSDYEVYTTSDGGFDFESNSLYLNPADTRSVFYDYALNAALHVDYEKEGDYITQVKTAKGLALLAYDVNKRGNDYSGHTVTLEDDITIPSDKIWEPIGHRVDCEEDPFRGTFDGKYHTINGLRSEYGYWDGGLFGYVVSGTIKNVLVESGSVSNAVNLGGLVGYLYNNSTVYNCEAQVASLTGLDRYTEYVGGLVGYIELECKVHSCCAMPGTISGNNIHLGGLAGGVSGSLENSFAYTSATNSLCDFGFGSVENCYLRAIGSGFSFNSGDYTHCYANVGTADGSNGVFGSTQLFDGKYGFNPIDQQVTGGDADYVVNGGLSNEGEFGGLLATLNKWVDEQPASMGYSRWTRTMASPINDDYPVLMFNEAVCVGSRDNVFLDYATDLNPMIQAYNNVSGGGDIYLYDVTSEINQNTGSDVRVYINENIGVLQTTGNTINARVGVTLDNSDGSWLGGAPYDWHMFSSALTAANMGLEYHSGVNDDYYVKNNYSTLSTNGIPNSVYNNPSCMDPTKTTWSNTNIGYFPTNTPYGTWRGNTDPTGSFDFYCYSEPYVHWINFKREGVTSFYDHWQQNEDADQMHQNIPYLNESTMEQGKGYMVALSQTSMLMADGVLNNGDSNGEVTRNVTATDVGNILHYENELQGVNLIGNPFQSYLNFDEFYNENDINTYYILDADAKKYIAYTAGQSDPVAPKKLHPHQGFFVKVDAGDDVTFTPRMRYTTGGTFRDDDVPHYPLVNLNVADAQGRNDYTIIELERPEAGGGEKAKGLRTGDASVWFHLDNIDWQTAFTVPGLHEAPVRFKAYADGMFTMTWETRNASFSYMHLIDNKTGMDVDCLSQSEYRFEGKTTDYLSRFRLVFEFTGIEEEEEAVETETFAFMMGDELVVNGGPSTGSETAMLQIFDLNGRCVYATELYDMQSIVTLPKMSAGVYILRLTGSKSTRTQKMVIK